MQEPFLRVELHCHTEFSFDGHIGYDALVAAAAKQRLDVVGITDHDTISGALEYQRFLAKKDASLRVIVGEERTLADGSHLIGLFLRESLVSDTLPGIQREIIDQGGILVVPHPYRAVSGALRAGAPELPGVCFEIFNPTCSRDENALARSLEQRGWIPVGGSDAHYAGHLGRCVNLIPLRGPPEDSVRHALLGHAALSILGERQNGNRFRRYAPPAFRKNIPRSLRTPAVKILQFLSYCSIQPEMEIKYAGAAEKTAHPEIDRVH